MRQNCLISILSQFRAGIKRFQPKSRCCAPCQSNQFQGQSWSTAWGGLWGGRSAPLSAPRSSGRSIGRSTAHWGRRSTALSTPRSSGRWGALSTGLSSGHSSPLSTGRSTPRWGGRSTGHSTGAWGIAVLLRLLLLLRRGETSKLSGISDFEPASSLGLRSSVFAQTGFCPLTSTRRARSPPSFPGGFGFVPFCLQYSGFCLLTSPRSATAFLRTCAHELLRALCQFPSASVFTR